MRAPLPVLLLLLTGGAAPFTLVLDPGHGPADPGALSATGVRETAYNEALTAALEAQLAGREGLRVVRTRAAGEQIGWDVRLARIAAADADLVLSIHHDSLQPRYLSPCAAGKAEPRCSEHAAGFSLFVPGSGRWAEASRRAAAFLARGLISDGRQFSRYHAEAIPGESRSFIDETLGIYDGSFLLLSRKVRAPLVLFEAGFLPNPKEEARLSDPAQVTATARLLAAAVEELAFTSEMERVTAEPKAPRVNDEAIRYPDALPGVAPLRWEPLAEGLELARAPVYFRGRYVDRLTLVRADPRRYRLSVHFSEDAVDAPTWRERLGATVVVNSSFYEQDPYAPQTPLLSGGRPLGPARYASRHGALLAEPRRKGLRPFAIQAFDGKVVDLSASGYGEGVVSYPLLLDAHGRVRAVRNPAWRASRTFVAEDREGRILLGTTEGGFFSLERLGRFLRDLSDLRLRAALNLDGGPPTQLALGSPSRELVVRGRWESNDSPGREVIFWGEELLVWPLPGVIALTPR